MSTAALTGLLEYLYGTLSASNMRWVADHLIEQASKKEKEQAHDLTPYTMQEIDDMLDEAEAATTCLTRQKLHSRLATT